MEEFKEYPLNNKYTVSTEGRIFSNYYNKEVTPKVNWDGYHRVQIWNCGKCNFVSWHRVVAETFLEKKEGCNVVNHINGIKTDNRVENLEWVTQAQNIKHAFDTGLSKKIKNGKTSKKIKQYDKEGNFIKEWESTMEIERQLKIHHGSISSVCKDKVKTAGGFVWKYSETSND